jgi:voltage-gated potassium channel
MDVRRIAHGAGAEAMRVARGSSKTHEHLRDRLLAVAAVTVVVDLLASVVILFFERRAPGTAIHTYGDSLFWTTTQLLTVSSQLPNPISAGARILDVGLQAYAITVVAALAGAFGAFFHRRSAERAEAGG